MKPLSALIPLAAGAALGLAFAGASAQTPFWKTWRDADTRSASARRS